MTLTWRRAPGSFGPRPPLPAGTPAPPAPASRPPTIPARGLRSLVRLYQLVFSGRPSPCRYYPSCSAYAAEALEVHGAARGSWLTVRRLLRCHPWGGHGVDPVPPAHRSAPVPSAPAPVPN